MDRSDDIIPVTALKSNSARLIRRTRETGRPIMITQNGRATAVIQDVETYERQREALLLLKAVVQGDEDFRAGRSLDHGEAVARLARRIRRGG